MSDKVHYLKYYPYSDRPCYMTIEEWSSQTICGYVRNKVTKHKEKVTCFYCNHAIERQRRLLKLKGIG